MPVEEKPLRQSITLPPEIARQVKSLAKAGRTSASRILVELIESGLEARAHEKRHFMALADRLAESQDSGEQARLKSELARLTFGS